MAELVGKTEDQGFEHEAVIRQGITQSIAQWLHRSKLIAVGKNLVNRIRTHRLSVANLPETREWHELDENTKQLWTTYIKGNMENPNPPISFVR